MATIKTENKLFSELGELNEGVNFGDVQRIAVAGLLTVPLRIRKSEAHPFRPDRFSETCQVWVELVLVICGLLSWPGVAER